MAFINLKFFSEVLGMQTEACVILPQQSCEGQIGISSRPKPGNYKCLYLLHGLSDDQSIWMRETSIERYASEYGICVVMPRADQSFYTDMKYGLRYYTYIAEELPRLIQEFFHVSDRREDNFIAGLSMGGYGALKIALRNGDRFCAAAGLSPAIHLNIRPLDRSIMVPIFGEDLVVPKEDNLMELIQMHDQDPNRPRLYVGIGTEDFLYDANQDFREAISKLHYDFTYRESAGTHCWTFWNEYIQYVLAWMFRS